MLSRQLGFRATAGLRQPTDALAPEFRQTDGATGCLFPNFPAPPYPNVSERGNGVMSRSPHPLEAN